MIFVQRRQQSPGQFLLALLILAIGVREGQSEIDSRFDEDWRFHRGEHPGAEGTDLDDSAWAKIRLPHDWAIAGPFNLNESGYAAKLPWQGTGWYRKHVHLREVESPSRIYLDFDGVMAFPRVYVNGQLAGEWDYGYTSFRVDVTPFVRFGHENVIAVRVDTTQHSTRWYPGAGIYRKVRLVIKPDTHLAEWGTHITTPDVQANAATVLVSNQVDHHGTSAQPIAVEVTLLDPQGAQVAQATSNRTIAAREVGVVEQSFSIQEPLRWDTDSPNLYIAKTRLLVGGQEYDSRETAFGIRTFQFTANDGFHLNGRRVQLRGVNLHHDHGPLGAAFYERAMQRQLEIMQEMGANAIRTSHNPSAPELLELCDRMGFLVFDEVFDKWDEKAGRIQGQPPLGEHAERHIRSLALRDRNHPCVVLWSIGNEISNAPYDPQGNSPERVTMMRDVFLKYDPTRPVAIACHIPETANTEILDSLDVVGWNYAQRYSIFRKRYPQVPIVYSESASALSTRGFYELPHPTIKEAYSASQQVDSYDLNAAPWSDIVDAEFRLMEKDSFVAGEFVWTGFDYLGEPTPFTEQARSSYFGIVDLCGIPKDRYYLYRSHWRPDIPTVHILPHWNWPNRLGQPTPVVVYTNGDSAELFLNGRSLGRQQKGKPPEMPANLASQAPARASSTTEESDPAFASDGSATPGWRAAENDRAPWWEVDLGSAKDVRYLALEFDHEAKHYGIAIKASVDRQDWQVVCEKPTSGTPRWGGSNSWLQPVEARARYVRVEFTDLRQRTEPGIRSFGAYESHFESPYYASTYDYRLRWENVFYEPGELRAIAYTNGQEIGQAVIKTAGEPETIRLSPDRVELAATGDDLCYVLVEALDKHGVPCPLAINDVTFSVTGPASIAGVGNGNPLSYAPFQSHQVKLFYGKAMLILRTASDAAGDVRIAAGATGLSSTDIVVRTLLP